MDDCNKKKESPASTSTPLNFSCVLCSEGFLTRGELQTHFRGHASDTSTKKPKKSSTPVDLVAIQCDVCGAQFTSNTMAIQHKFRKHPQVSEKHHCPTCGMAFTIKSLLDRHLTSHLSSDSQDATSESPCSTCSAKFDNQSALEYHVKTTHKRVMKLYQPVETAPPSKKIKINNAGDVQSVYYCHICGSEYIVKFNLQKHLESFHTEEERFAAPTDLIRCTACDALFYNRKAYDNHNIGHKPSDLYVTNEQQRLKMVSRVDQDFDVRRVLPLAEKYVPSYRRRRRRTLSSVTSRTKRKKVADEEEELSPPPSPDSSDSDSDSPLMKPVTVKP